LVELLLFIKSHFSFSLTGFVGYLIDSTTAIPTNVSVYIGDVLDRNRTVFVDNCTQLMCKPDGLKKDKVPCRGESHFYFKEKNIN
jgi:hypothetical protein